LQNRNLTLIAATNNHLIITENKMIIDYTIEYVRIKQFKNWKVILDKINTVFLYKLLYLPIELVSVDRGKTMNVYHNDFKVSSIQ